MGVVQEGVPYAAPSSTVAARKAHEPWSTVRIWREYIEIT